MDKNEFSGDKLQLLCDCGEVTYVFVEPGLSCTTLCRMCHRNIYQLQCPKCQSGFGFPEGTKEINKDEGWWKCEVCNQKNTFAPSSLSLVSNYHDNEIPKEIADKYKDSPAMIVFRIVIILIILALGYLSFKFGLGN